MLPACLGSSRIGHPRPRPLLVEPLEPRCLLDGLGLLPPAYGWTQALGASGFDAAVAIQQDTAGDLIIAGFFEGTVVFGDQDSLTSQGGYDIFVARLGRNSDGKIDPVTESGWYEFTGVPIGKFEIRQIPPLPSIPPVDPGGQDPPDDPGGNLPGDTTVVELTAADLQGLAGSVRFPSPILMDIEAGDESWTQVIIPGSDGLNGMQGTPAVPVFRRLIALPLGVEAKDVTVDLGQGPSVAKTFTGVHLYPFQPSPVDAVPDALYGDGSFVKDAAAYASQLPWSAELVRVSALGGLRGMNLALLEFAAARYTPTDQRLVVFDRVDWSLHFPAAANQEERGFLTEREMGPFENASELHTTVLNAAAVFEHLVPGGGGAASCFGVEYLILTHRDFREAADRLAEWKNAKGIGDFVRENHWGVTSARLSRNQNIRATPCSAMVTKSSGSMRSATTIRAMGTIRRCVITTDATCRRPWTIQAASCGTVTIGISAMLCWTAASWSPIARMARPTVGLIPHSRHRREPSG